MGDIESLKMEMDAQARANLAFALKRIAEVQQVVIAQAINVSAPTVSRFVADDLPRACAVLAAAGVKFVLVETAVFEPRKIQVLLDLARDYLQQLDSPDQLQWD